MGSSPQLATAARGRGRPGYALLVSYMFLPLWDAKRYDRSSQNCNSVPLQLFLSFTQQRNIEKPYFPSVIRQFRKETSSKCRVWPKRWIVSLSWGKELPSHFHAASLGAFAGLWLGHSGGELLPTPGQVCALGELPTDPRHGVPSDAARIPHAIPAAGRLYGDAQPGDAQPGRPTGTDHAAAASRARGGAAHAVARGWGISETRWSGGGVYWEG